ncbi:MAG: MEKHLA domain-containing protein [Candidatus Nanopelagicales bacterium]|nr:MEKHLA domain-containing protein [Candidatus Nanopelagicales bacterium]
MVDTAIIRAILDSYLDRVGADLIPRNGADSADAEALHQASIVVLCHDGAEDPVLIYANAAAAALWKMPVEKLIGLPSRFTAAAQHQPDRAEALDSARSAGVLYGYSGERVASDGTRFMIRQAVLWTVDGLPQGVGQAAMFTSWEQLDQIG